MLRNSVVSVFIRFRVRVRHHGKLLFKLEWSSTEPKGSLTKGDQDSQDFTGIGAVKGIFFYHLKNQLI